MKKLILSLVLIFLFSLSSLKLYVIAEDANKISLTSENTHVVISQSIDTANGKYLVPKGAILGVNDVEEIEFTYLIFVQYGVEVDYFINDIEINDDIASQDVKDLFVFDFKVNIPENHHIQLEFYDDTEAGYYMEVTVVLSMNFPTEEQYLEIAGQHLSFDITFESD